MTQTIAALGGHSWTQTADLAVALVLSTAIGLEREIRQKSAGLRTHTLVGIASALIMLVSKFGFGDVFGDHVALDPSRIAAQIVSGIGFIGGGLIFIRGDAVRGLTTAATIWLTAAIGMAAGAGLWPIAVLVTAGHFLVTIAYTPLAARLPRSKYAPIRLSLSYHDGHGVLRNALAACTARGFSVHEMTIEQHGRAGEADDTVSVSMSLAGSRSIDDLTTTLAGLDGLISLRNDASDEVPT
ncbi:putative Mg2+ transporter-C (MgtC) family protein [Hamadaea flava]|uniref:MgtC/SapB family protein n=1 Tax=Hamadaea flava TaxID=1742688 RepID=A0ABV8LM06_9ACTN|nr:MgtC/SapB family protein [Hamadaea flava]MCP2329594.1 putative Mg2+ transporter-C (MgtC) family protein [Hamadaea flava]